MTADGACIPVDLPRRLGRARTLAKRELSATDGRMIEAAIAVSPTLIGGPAAATTTEYVQRINELERHLASKVTTQRVRRSIIGKLSR